MNVAHLDFGILFWVLCRNSHGEFISPSIYTADQRFSDTYTYLMLSDYGLSLHGATEIILGIKACKSAFIALKDSRTEPIKFYEIVIGGWGNEISVIRAQKQGSAQNVHSEDDLLSCSEFRRFKISWLNGNISLQKSVSGGLFSDVFAWQDPKPMSVNFVGVSTGQVGSGTWIYVLSDAISSTTKDITTVTTAKTSVTSGTQKQASVTTMSSIDSMSTQGQATTSKFEALTLTTSALTTNGNIDTTVPDIVTTMTSCPCNPVFNYSTVSPRSLEETIKELVKVLKIDKKKTSVYKRTRVSATDDRASAKAVGIVGVVVLIALLFLLILIDLQSLCNMFKIMRRNVCSNNERVCTVSRKEK